MTTLSRRLRWAIKHQPSEGRSRGIGLLLRKLEGHKVKGATYPSMTAYLAGTQQPSLEFLRAVAEVTGVSARWLILGDGPPTREARVARAVVSAATAERVEALKLQADVFLALGFMPVPLPEPPGQGGAEAVTAYEGRVEGAALNMAPWLPALAEAQRLLCVDPAAVGQALRGPLTALDIDTSQISQDALNGYVTAMLPVLLGLVAPRRDQKAPQPRGKRTGSRKKKAKKTTRRRRK